MYFAPVGLQAAVYQQARKRLIQQLTVKGISHSFSRFLKRRGFLSQGLGCILTPLRRGLRSGQKHSKQHNTHTFNESFHLWMNYLCFCAALQLDSTMKPCHPSLRSPCLQWVVSSQHGLATISWFWAREQESRCPTSSSFYRPQVRLIVGCTEIHCETASYRSHDIKMSDWHCSMWGYYIYLQTVQT